MADLDAFLVPKIIPSTWMLNLKCSRDDHRNIHSPGPKSHNGRGKFQLVHAIEELADRCS